jgi:hypothetical protein
MRPSLGSEKGKETPKRLKFLRESASDEKEMAAKAKQVCRHSMDTARLASW